MCADGKAGFARIALFTQQVSHYHAARYRAARGGFGELRVFSAMNSADFDEFLARGGEFDNVVRLYEGAPRYTRAVVSGALWKRVHALLDEYKPEVVVVAGWSFAESLAAIAWARRNAAHVVIMSDSQFHDAMRSDWREAIKERVVSACDAALVAAGPHGDYASRLGVPPERVFFGYDTVDNEHFTQGADLARLHDRALRTARGLPERYLLACGRFVPKKNYPGLVEAFARAIDISDHGFDLMILGDGPERDRIESTARRYGIAHRLRLPGFRPYEMLPMFYGLASAFVHVSFAEQWGLVINEAAAAGLPLVVSRPCGASAALVEDHVNGFLVEPDVDQVSWGLEQIMSLDELARKHMGNESRRIAADWSPTRYAEGLRAACEAALECPPRELGWRDRMLLRGLSRLRISRVS